MKRPTEEMNIYLIGFMGSGKSTIGRLLAEALAYQWVDLDEHIVTRNQMSVRGIFKKYGERFFRKEEATVLRNTMTLEKAVVSCGGGTPCFENNMNWINQHGISIFIDPTVEVLLNRLVKGQEKRPLLREKNLEELETFIQQKLEERRPVYEQAHIHYQQAQDDAPSVELIIKKMKAYHANSS